MYKSCGICTYKYSCGYSSILGGEETGKCCQPHLFARADGLRYSYVNQKLEPESEVRKEESLTP